MGAETLGSTAGQLPPAAAQGLADAFSATYRWAMALAAVAIVPAVILARVSRPGGNEELAEAIEPEELVGAAPR